MDCSLGSAIYEFCLSHNLTKHFYPVLIVKVYVNYVVYTSTVVECNALMFTLTMDVLVKSREGIRPDGHQFNP